MATKSPGRAITNSVIQFISDAPPDAHTGISDQSCDFRIKTYIEERLVVLDGVFVSANQAPSAEWSGSPLHSGYFWMRHCEACIFVYDVGSKISFDAVKRHYGDYLINRSLEQSHCALSCSPSCGPRPPYQGTIFVIANKIDLDKPQWEITREDGQEFCDSIGATFIQMSAKTGEGGGTSILKGIANRIILQRVQVISAGKLQDLNDVQIPNILDTPAYRRNRPFWY